MKTLKQDSEEKGFVCIVPYGKLRGQIFNSQAPDSNVLTQMNTELGTKC